MSVSYDRSEIEKIGILITEFQTSSDPNLKKTIIANLSPYIRFYPCIAFSRFDEDIKSDFYLYVLERIDPLIDHFQPQVGKFVTYLSIRLKTYYLNFVNRDRRNLQKDPLGNSATYSIDGEENPHVTLTLAEPPAPATQIVEEKETSNIDKINYDKIKDPLTYLTIKLYFFCHFNDEDFVKLHHFTKKPYGTLLGEIDLIREDIHKKELEQIQYEKKLQGLYNELLEIQIQTNFDQDREKKVNLRREKILQRYYQLNLTPTVKLIATLLEQPLSKITNIISYYKKKSRAM